MQNGRAKSVFLGFLLGSLTTTILMGTVTKLTNQTATNQTGENEVRKSQILDLQTNSHSMLLGSQDTMHLNSPNDSLKNLIQ